MKYDAQVEPIFDKDIVCSIGRKDGVIDKPHEHEDHYQIEILLEGTAVDLSRKVTQPLLPFQINAIDPAAHHQTHYRNTDSLFFFVSRQAMASHLMKSGHKKLEPSFNPVHGHPLLLPAPVLKSEVNSLWTLYNGSKNAPNDLMLRDLMRERTYSCLNVVLENLIATPRQSAKGYHAQLVARTCEWIHDHFKDENLNIDNMAENANLSKFHFARTFRQITGESPVRYLQRVRVGRARELETHGRLTKLEIAMAVGFQSVKQLNYHDALFPKERACGWLPPSPGH